MYSTKVFNNLIWRFTERMCSQGISLVVSIILARMLGPEVYGTIALVNVFIAVLQVFVDSGFASALIQKKDSDDTDFSTVFYLNLVICGVLYAIMFFSAPLIGEFYQQPELVPVIRVLSLTLVISGVKNVQQAYVSKKLIFKKFFYATLIATIGSAIVGIFLAFKGFGIWALVGQTLFINIVSTITLWFSIDWKPKLLFSFERLKGLFSFGWKLLVSSLIDTVYIKTRQLLIGKIYTASDLAFYNKGDQYPNLLVTNINMSIDSVLFPVMSDAQDDFAKVKAMVKRSIKTSSYIVWPIMFGLAAVATPFIRVILTEEWLPCAFYMQMFCFIYCILPIHTATINAIKAIGRSDIYLKQEIAKKIVGVVAMLATIFISIRAMTYSYLFTSVLSLIINAYPVARILKYSFKEMLKDVFPSALMSIVMFAGCWPIQFINMPDIVMLIVQIFVGLILYLGMSILFKNESFYYVLNIVKSKFKKGA